MDREPQDSNQQIGSTSSPSRPSHQDWRAIALLVLLALGAGVLLVALSVWAR